VEDPPRSNQVLRWGLNVQDAIARGHVLGAAVADRSAAPVGVLM